MIDFNKILFQMLTGVTALTGYTGYRFFPLIAPENTEFPFVITSRSFAYEYTKSGVINGNNLNFNLDVVSLTYDESINLSKLIENAFLNFNIYNHENADLYNIRLIQISENFNENAYIQTMQFSCNVYKK